MKRFIFLILPTLIQITGLGQSITGPTSVKGCIDTSYAYIASTEAGDTSYEWFPVDFNPTFLDANNTSSPIMHVDFFGQSSDGTLKVLVHPSMRIESLFIHVIIKLNRPFNLQGENQICKSGKSTPVRYTIDSMAGATSYHWKIPSNAHFFGSNDKDTILLTFSPTDSLKGLISVRGYNQCGESLFPDTLKITFSPFTPVNVKIIGPTSFCETSSDTVKFRVKNNYFGANQYEWYVNNDLREPNDTIFDPHGNIHDGDLIICRFYIDTVYYPCHAYSPAIDTIKLTIFPTPVAGSLTTKDTVVCQGSKVIITLSEFIKNISSWQRKQNDGEWQAVNASLSNPLIQNDLTIGKWTFRANVQSGNCDSATSKTKTINVIQGPTIDTTQTIVAKGSPYHDVNNSIFLICQGCAAADEFDTLYYYKWGYYNALKEPILYDSITNNQFCIFPKSLNANNYFLKVSLKSSSGPCDLTFNYSSTELNVIKSIINVYPNPNNGNMNLIVENEYTGTTEIIVKDILGNELQRIKVDKQSPQLNVKISLPGEKMKGIYFIQTRFGDTDINTVKTVIY